MAHDVVLLLSTFPDAEIARKTTLALVEKKLVACGNILPGVESIYRWKGKIETATEVMVIFKTMEWCVLDATEQIKALHPYEVPEILCITIDDGWPDYLKWVEESVEDS
jgi:periplasmic divalent cation tolerance protein